MTQTNFIQCNRFCRSKAMDWHLFLADLCKPVEKELKCTMRCIVWGAKAFDATFEPSNCGIKWKLLSFHLFFPHFTRNTPEGNKLWPLFLYYHQHHHCLSYFDCNVSSLLLLFKCTQLWRCNSYATVFSILCLYL